MQVILNWHSTVKWQKMSKWYFRNSGKTYYLPLYRKSLLPHYPWITEFYCSFQYDYFDTKIKKGISITESLLQVGNLLPTAVKYWECKKTWEMELSTE